VFSFWAQKETDFFIYVKMILKALFFFSFFFFFLFKKKMICICIAGDSKLVNLIVNKTSMLCKIASVIGDC
jgi:hypothetical protein